MPRKTSSKTSQDRRAAEREAALLRETQGLFLAIAACLDGFLGPAYGLWKRLARTDAYRRAAGLDEAEGEPIWDLAGTVESMLVRDINDMTAYLRRDAREAGVAAARRARIAARRR